MTDVFDSLRAEIAVDAVTEATLVRTNDALMDHGLRVSRLPKRTRDPITAVDIARVLSEWPKHNEARCFADDVELLFTPDTIPFDLRIDEKGIMRFRRGTSPRPSESALRAAQNAACRHRNDSDGITYHRPPWIVLVGDTIAGSTEPGAPRFVFTLQRAPFGAWDPPGESSDPLLIRWIKQQLLWEMQ
jgi:hypothetical protein